MRYYCKELLFLIEWIGYESDFQIKKFENYFKFKKDITIISKNNNKLLKFKIIKYTINDRIYLQNIKKYNITKKKYKQIFTNSKKINKQIKLFKEQIKDALKTLLMGNIISADENIIRHQKNRYLLILAINCNKIINKKQSKNMRMEKYF